MRSSGPVGGCVLPNACGAVERLFNRLRTLRSLRPCHLVSLRAGGVPQFGHRVSPFASLVAVIAGLVSLIASLVTLLGGHVTLLSRHVTLLGGLISLVGSFISLVGGVVPGFAGFVSLPCRLVSLVRTPSRRLPH